MITVQNAKKKAKDTRRKAELTALAHTLDQIYVGKGSYPVSNPCADCNDDSCKGQIEDLKTDSCTGTSLRNEGVDGSIPNDPSGVYYQYQSDGTYYVLTASLEDRSKFILTSSNSNVLVVVNDNSPESLEVAKYYQKRRGISDINLVHISTSTDEYVTWQDFVSQIRDPVKQFIEDRGLKDKILYIVPTYGVPTMILTNHNAISVPSVSEVLNNKDPYVWAFDTVESWLAGMYLEGPEYFNYPGYTGLGQHGGVANPVYDSNPAAGNHISASSNVLLVSRLDGPTPQIAKGLVDKAIYGERYVNSTYGQGYITAFGGSVDPSICNVLSGQGYPCTNSTSTNECASIADPNMPMLWHYGGCHWYCENTNNWKPGAIDYHLRSFTSLGSVRSTGAGSQFVPNGLAAGITATTGSASEPFVAGIAVANVFFSAFVNGNSSLNNNHFSFGESIYKSLHALNWRAVVVGDPLYTLTNNNNQDTSAPKITDLKYVYSDNSATVSWDNLTSEDGSPEITTGKVEINGIIKWDNSSFNNSPFNVHNNFSQHKITIPNLNTGETYSVTVTATDPAGNTTTKTFQMNYSTTEVSI